MELENRIAKVKAYLKGKGPQKTSFIKRDKNLQEIEQVSTSQIIETCKQKTIIVQLVRICFLWRGFHETQPDLRQDL